MSVEARPLSGALGAELFGVDLGAPLPDADLAAVRDALLEHAVVFFRDQDLTPERQLAFARHFGEPEVHPIVVGLPEHPEVLRVHKPAGQPASFGTGWHTDNTFFECPSLGTVLYGDVIPPYGGDTLFASMTRAYQALSDTMKEMLDGLVAVHSAARAYDPRVTGEEKYRGDAPMTYRWSEAVEKEVEHPVVRIHPETGAPGLFVNPMFTQRIAGLTDAESRALLDFLYEHVTRPEFTCRFRWEPRSVAFWDNRCVQHYAMDDYQDFERVMTRVTIAGDRPF
ncbi:MAG: TauD/TfdA dioxygenase family protein [Myxococcota bacterium]